MTTIFNDPEDFARTALEGFGDVYRRYVHTVRGGVVRSTKTAEGKVAVVIGGGSGHYPAFCGYVGKGMADAAVAGDVFASPSTAAVARICRLAEKGGGVLLGFGNYAGDVLNFGAAANRLRGEGIDVRILAVTDDIASASADIRAKRRGVAGDVAVFKIAGAAAEAGETLDEVERIAVKANERTVSLGVAFAGCTLPGATEPLFTVERGQMAVGLGIHGEPGIRTEPVMTSSALGAMLVDALLVERPEGVTKVAAILNGLGSSKYEELFVLWTDIASRLKSVDLDIVEPEVGEFVTSLDMQGCSLTLVWLDEELEQYWRAACDTPVLRKGETISGEPAAAPAYQGETAPTYPPASQTSRDSAACIVRLLDAMATDLRKVEERLGQIDALAGDGDHGQGMTRGSTAASKAASAAAQAGAGAASVLAAAGDAWADRAGGTSGAIWGILLRAWSSAFSDQEPVAAASIVTGARRALENVMELGGAKPGDKTLIDAFVPFVEVLEAETRAGSSIASAWEKAAAASTEGADRTSALTPRLGRARPLAHLSIGHPDAGAISLALCATGALAQVKALQG
jgi:dihydroxyacetone kinase